MRIKRIEINGLFEMFDHPIELNLKKRLTILYGINGIGKTIVFRMLNAFYNFNFQYLLKIPFNEFIIRYENGSYFRISSSKKNLTIEYFEKSVKKNNPIISEQIEQIKFRKKESPQFERFLSFIENSYPEFRRISFDKFIFAPTQEILTLDEIIERFPNLFPNEALTKEPIPNNLKKIISQTKLHFIQTQRLLLFSERMSKQYFKEHDQLTGSRIETVSKYSKDLSSRIREKLNEYRKMSESLELSLGKRLLEKKVKIDFSIDELKKEFDIVENERRKLKDVGLLSETRDENFYLPENIDNLSLAVISVNIQDMKSKLKIFDGLYEKLSIFLDILNNKRFSYKNISVNEKTGFTFKNIKGKELSPNDLSSGEQHELVMLYDLLFNVPDNTLVLIDEPEISLHIKWQKELLHDLEEIINLRNFDVLLATHSPSIINGNWELTVALQGIEKDE